MARFRLFSHQLAICKLSWARPRVVRDERVCPCCRTEREDELHLLTCPHHVSVRHDCLGEMSAAGGGDTFGDAWMRQMMNPEEASGWRRLADFLIRALAQRDAAERGDAPQADLPDDAYVA